MGGPARRIGEVKSVRVERMTVHEALFDHRRSHSCEWSDDATCVRTGMHGVDDKRVCVNKL